jgi:uncharacterized membrane protein YgaE (UPF0421/DUF939 family)
MVSFKIKRLKKPIYMSFEAGIIALVTFVFGYKMTIYIQGPFAFLDGIWCMANALGVLYAHMGISWIWAKHRLISNLIGCLVAMLTTMFFGANYFTLFLAITIMVFFIDGMQFEKGFGMSSTVVVSVIGVKIFCPKLSILTIAGLRFLEAGCGVLIGTFAVYASYKYNIRTYQKK